MRYSETCDVFSCIPIHKRVSSWKTLHVSKMWSLQFIYKLLIDFTQFFRACARVLSGCLRELGIFLMCHIC